MFNGEADSGLDKTKVHGSHIPGTKNVPIGGFVDSEGHILPEDKIKEKLAECGFDRSKPTVTLCNMGIQASMLATIIDSVYADAELKVYNVRNFSLVFILVIFKVKIQFSGKFERNGIACS